MEHTEELTKSEHTVFILGLIFANSLIACVMAIAAVWTFFKAPIREPNPTCRHIFTNTHIVIGLIMMILASAYYGLDVGIQRAHTAPH